MRIHILGWQSTGLRCPDMEINLISENNVPQISLIQTFKCLMVRQKQLH
ncbi:hypothetical protein I4641_19930 [Waterburya agarophytonicola K14]|uniref:Uncharacterized protein n=1 Tax=Waterburya agarophytonicola KI4 TaxID=2874699 RepID=A0A964BX55_9CYAN|nr:hypothetical protein [Waterburya agarophytonicola]MCC0179236.1 hypothetical protein [Waterburya agarophytonicola KI4]